jgi:hypothetical protein
LPVKTFQDLFHTAPISLSRRAFCSASSSFARPIRVKPASDFRFLDEINSGTVLWNKRLILLLSNTLRDLSPIKVPRHCGTHAAKNLKEYGLV